jgi:hypothetical protein
MERFAGTSWRASMGRLAGLEKTHMMPLENIQEAREVRDVHQALRTVSTYDRISPSRRDLL